MGRKRPPLPSRGTQLFVQFDGEGGPRGRDRRLPKNQLRSLLGLAQQGVHPHILAAQPATPVVT